MTPAKPCASCLSRPRRLVCLRCGDALCRRCAGHRACGCVLRVGVSEPAYAPPEMSSAPPKALPLPPAAPPSTPPRAAQTPVPSTTKPDAPGAGDGRAVPRAQGKTIAELALELAKAGPFYVGQLAERTGKPVETCRTTCWQLQQRGLLTYTPPPAGRAGRGRASGRYAAAVPVEQLVLPPSKRRNVHEPTRARAGEPAAGPEAELERDGVRRVPVEQAATPAPPAPVPGVHRSVADFFADTPPLPKHRPPVLPECGGGRHA